MSGPDPAALVAEMDAERDGTLAISDADDVESLWLAVERHAELQRKTDGDQTCLERDFGPLPVGLAFVADTHIGSKWVDMRALREFAQAVAGWRKRHPGALWAALLGDGTDAYVPGMGRVSKGLLEETETDLEKQDRLFVHWAKSLGGLDALTIGCHWAWSLNAIGRNPVRPIARELDAVDCGFGLYLKATVGEQTYHVVGRHKGRGLSALNTTNAHRSIYTAYEMPGTERADVVALAHLHVSNLHVQDYAGKRTIWLSAPGWKGGDCYARQIGVKHHADTGKGGMPLVILYPDDHRMVAFDAADWRLGLQVLAAERSRYGGTGA